MAGRLKRRSLLHVPILTRQRRPATASRSQSIGCPRVSTPQRPYRLRSAVGLSRATLGSASTSARRGALCTGMSSGGGVATGAGGGTAGGGGAGTSEAAWALVVTATPSTFD